MVYLDCFQSLFKNIGSLLEIISERIFDLLFSGFHPFDEFGHHVIESMSMFIRDIELLMPIDQCFFQMVQFAN